MSGVLTVCPCIAFIATTMTTLFTGLQVHFPSLLPFKATSEWNIMQLRSIFLLHSLSEFTQLWVKLRIFPLSAGHKSFPLYTLGANWGRGSGWQHKEFWSWDGNSELFKIEVKGSDLNIPAPTSLWQELSWEGSVTLDEVILFSQNILKNSELEQYT